MKHFRAIISADDSGSFKLTAVRNMSNDSSIETDDWNTITNAFRLMSVEEIMRWDVGRFDVSKWG